MSELSEPIVRIVVIGHPAPQGSKKAVGRDRKGRAILAESSKFVKPWREAVVWAARASRLELEASLDGPLHATFVFTLPKPKGAPKRRVTYPDRYPDVSKLMRSTEDALTAAGVIADDARIVGAELWKRYPNEGPGALDVPGAVIEIRRLV